MDWDRIELRFWQSLFCLTWLVAFVSGARLLWALYPWQ